MNKYVFGDIHGSYNALLTIFNNLQLNSSDQFIFLGDYIDRGRQSKEVLDFLIDLSQKYETRFIRGNHEIFMMTARLNQDRFNDWLMVGGDETLLSFRLNSLDNLEAKIDAKYWDFLENSLPYYTDDDFIYVHAGLEQGVPLDKQDMFSLFWKKYKTPIKYNNEKIVICGHTSRTDGQIANFGHSICIDTFAHGGQWLTCLNLSNGEYMQGSNKKKLRFGTIKIDNRSDS